MKKILTSIVFLFSFLIHGAAQKFIDVYQSGNVVGTVYSSDVDSVNISGDTFSSRVLKFWSGGKVKRSFYISEIDSVKVFQKGEDQLVYMGILAFNQQIYPMTIGVLSNHTKSKFTTFVDNLTSKDGTLLYYGVEKALDMLTLYNFTTPLTCVNLITFTDGLDQGSAMMNNKYPTVNSYLSYLSNRINTTTVRGLPLTAYSIGLKGLDVTNDEQFKANLLKLATSDENAFEASSISQVQSHLQNIAEKIISVTNRQNFKFKIPGQSDGTRVCFTFDNCSPDKSSLYIEGTFNLQNLTLSNVVYHGLRGSIGSIVQGIKNGIFVTFDFSGLQRDDVNGMIPTQYVRHYYKTSGSSIWQINSEFTPDGNTETTTIHSGAANILVLDCSNSLGSKFGSMKSYAKNFIETIASNAADFYLESPQNVKAAMDDDEWAVDVSWDAVKSADYYHVYRSDSYSSGYTKVADSLNENRWRDENPNKGSNYYKVEALGYGMTSETGTSNSVSCEIQKPKNVKAVMDDSLWQVNMSWDAVKYAEYYSVYRSKSSSSNYVLMADSLTSCSWHDENPLSEYNYYRISAHGHEMTAQSDYVRVNCVLDKPMNVVAAMDDSLWQVNVSWDAVKYAHHYQVYRSSSSSSGFTLYADSVSTNEWYDDNPLEGDNYYRVTAVYKDITSSTSSTSNSVNCVYYPPANVKASMDYDLWQVNVSWDAVKYAEYYSVYRSKSSSSNYVLVADSLISCCWQDKVPLNNNYYRVYAHGHGKVKQSNYVYVNCVLDKPTNVTAVMDDSLWQVNVSWDTVKYAQHYKVYRSISSSSGFTLYADSVSTNEWHDNNPLEGDNYYRVKAVCKDVSSSISSTSNSVNCVYYPPANVKASMDYDLWQVNVSWDAVKYAKYYSIYRSDLSSSDYVLVADGLTSCSWHDNAPLNNNYYRVCAHGFEISKQSEYVYVHCVLDKPTNVVAALNEDGGINVSWDAVKYAESYIVYRSYNMYSGYSIVADTVFTTSWIDKNPSYRNNYYRVQTRGHGITSDFSIGSNLVFNSKLPDNYVQVDVNGVKFSMVKVSGGTFQMNTGKNIHSVTLSDYYIGETEVTQELWEAVMGTTSGIEGVNRPVGRVSWDDCQFFITKLNQLTGQQFRLPTEAEWEFAARGGNSSKGYEFSGSDFIVDVAWYKSNSGSATHDVATKAPNELGLYDMSGNVREWCQDWYSNSYYSSSPVFNPTGPTGGSYRVLRGGSFYDYETSCSVSNRGGGASPSIKYTYIGLRLAL